MTSRRTFLINGLRIAGGLALAACAPTATTAPPSSTAAAPSAGATPRRGGTWVALVSADPASLNHNLVTDLSSIRAASGLYSALIELNEKFEPTPDLAESWTISPDGKRYEFKLRKNAKFHDGSAVTSEDVKYTMEEVSGKFNSISSGIFKAIDRIDTPDPNTLVLNLKGPSAVMLQSLGLGNMAILPKRLYEGTDPRNNPRNNNPIGSGPFKFKEWVKGDHITLVRNDDYYRPPLPYLDQFVSRVIPDGGARVIAFQTGEIDYIDGANLPRELASDLKKVPGVQYWEHAGLPGTQLMHMNIQKKPLDDLRVRQAIASAIDQKAVVDKAYFNVAAVPSISHIPADLTNFHDPSTKLPKYDVAKANQLLDDAGLRKGSDGIRFKLRITYVSTIDTDRRTAEVVRDNLKDVAIAVELDPRDAASIGKEVYTDGNFDLHNVQLTSNGDPAIGIDRWFTTGGIRVTFGNASRYSNPEIDKLFADAATTIDLAKRKDLYSKAQAILARDLPAFPVVDRGQLDFARPEAGGVFKSPYNYWQPGSLWLKQ
jgi:peptide/nickel transport system substrate-binding protein